MAESSGTTSNNLLGSPSIAPALSDLRQRLSQATKLATSHEPHGWQLDIAEALCNRRDVLCIAGTGSGKTLPFVMPCFVDPQAVVWIASPLNYIEQQQQRVFDKDWNVPTCCVNANTSYPGLHKDILKGKYRVIIASPEQLLEYNKLRPIIIQLSSQNWNNIVIIDECHCICLWSDQFRKMYGLLGSLRVFLYPGTPFCAATATLTRSMQKQVLSSLRYNDKFLFVNQGYWKPNLSWHIHYMKGSDSSVGEVTHMFHKKPTSSSDLKQALIFVDERNLAFRIFRVLRDFLPPELSSEVEVYHALQSQAAKDLIAKRFERGEIKILICTEALTMGCDFRNIELIIMFKLPKGLPTILQRGGRGGRDGRPCRVIIMVERSKYLAALQELRSLSGQRQETIKKEEEIDVDLDDQLPSNVIGIDELAALEREPLGGQDDGEEQSEATDKALRLTSIQHAKEDEEYLKRFYAPSKECRTRVLDAAFNSPLHAPCISVNGCDNCIRQRIEQLESRPVVTTRMEINPVKVEPTDTTNLLEDSIDDLRAMLIEPIPSEPRKRKPRGRYRSTDEREELEDILTTWREVIYESDCRKLGIHSDWIVTDKVITAISRLRPPVSLDSLVTTTPAWPEKAFDLWGQSLLEQIKNFDTPSRVVARNAERGRAKKEKKSSLKLQSTGEGASSSSIPKARGRKPNETVSVVSGSKKPRNQPAESAASAVATSSPAHVTVQPPDPMTPNRTSQSAPKHSSYSTQTPSQSTPPSSIPRPVGQSPSYYRPHTYKPPNKTPELLPSHPVIPGSANLNRSNTSLIPRAVGTMYINPSQTMLPNPSAPITSTSTTPPANIKNPGAKKSYYRDHTWK